MPDGVHFNRLAIFGVGLLGGAIGRKSKEIGLARHVIGIGRDRQRLESACAMGAIDEWTTDIQKGVTDCELLILCVPVQKIIEYMPIVAKSVSSGTIVTDVGSTKKSIVETGKNLFHDNIFFVGSHPMTGSDKSGCLHSSEVAFKGVTCFVAVAPETDYAAAAKVALFWKALGMIPVIIDPTRHDDYVALVSHVPHLVSAALANAVSMCPEDLNFIRQICGKGFRDTTRLAMGDPPMWVEIFLENRQNIVNYLDGFIKMLARIKAAINNGDKVEIENFFASAKSFRKKFD
ncbi:MAG TPA: prephenate dehydrogenase [Candidatus Sumerlaeota bacterium]|nr:MAG: prephenate dehydrogenase [candidate division BRC1 bacterium ADurb.Bin183]HOE64005.1 prephenate dehydrogenase [Candidatus Sumerlaeota bacterium]HRR30460.1 prephenate dehydrogenase [Candidatus Sumerlaeia bacterium]HON51074.1 prephenate dehydrogenase [Candidatus Sumerlaeota bacterium]HOR65047.1 prephenate dehydrogenase [Candidatus Sumerlaeota bacterium]